MDYRPDIAASVDPNVSDDVCTFCRHARFTGEITDPPTCGLGHTPYFRSLSNYGPIWVSDCGAGELKPELAAADKTKQPSDSEQSQTSHPRRLKATGSDGAGMRPGESTRPASSDSQHSIHKGE